MFVSVAVAPELGKLTRSLDAVALLAATVEGGDGAPDEGEDRVGAGDRGEGIAGAGAAFEDREEPPEVGGGGVEEGVEAAEVRAGDAAEAGEEAAPPFAVLDEVEGPV